MNESSRPLGLTVISVLFFCLGLLLLSTPLYPWPGWSMQRLRICVTTFDVTTVKLMATLLGTALVICGALFWKNDRRALGPAIAGLVFAVVMEIAGSKPFHAAVDALLLVYLVSIMRRR